MNTYLNTIQGADFDILATDIKSSELIGHNITGTASPSLIVSFPENEKKDEGELLVTDNTGKIIPIKTNIKYESPLKNNNNNISLNYNLSYLNTDNGVLTLSNNVINKINIIENNVTSITDKTESVDNELKKTQNDMNKMSIDMNNKYNSLNDAILSKQIKYAINMDESVTPSISENTIFEDTDKIYDIAGNIHLNNTTAVVGKNSALKFSGGKISQSEIYGNNTEIIASKYKLFDNCKLKGTFTNKFLPEWFGAIGDGNTNDSPAINSLLNMNISNDIVFSNDKYSCQENLLSIKNNIHVSGEIDLCGNAVEIQNVKLIFSGNGKITNGKIKFNHTEIIGDSNQIFENIIFTENSIITNDAIKVEWFGAKGDGKTDDSEAINNTIEQVSKLKSDNINVQPAVLLSHNIYYIKSTIYIYENNSRFISLGTIITTDDIVAVEVCGNNIDIDINAIKNRKSFDINDIPGLHPWDNPKLFIGTAFRIQQTVFNSKININVIDRYKNGIIIKPRLFKDYYIPETQTGNRHHPDNLFAGIQYCEFNFKMIHAQKCVEINVAPDKDTAKEQETYIDYNNFWIWVNENNFNGGRFFCVQNTSEFDPATALGKDSGYGLYMVEGTDKENSIGLACGGIDGNMFNHIGFEGLWQAIKLWKCKFHIFNDIRMAESLYAGTISNDKEQPWIELNDCGNCDFNIKGLIPMDKIKITKCKSINFNGQFTEPDNPSGSDWFGIIGNKFTNLYADNAIKTYNINGKKVISDNPAQNGFYGILPQTGIKSENLITLIYKDKNTDNTNLVYNFNDLFAKTGTKLKDGKSFTLSNLCRISLWDEKCITIDFKDSVWGLHPDMTLKVSLGPNSKIHLVHGDTKLYVDGQKTVNAIEKSGLYKITYRLNCNNVQDEIYILPLYYDK